MPPLVATASSPAWILEGHADGQRLVEIIHALQLDDVGRVGRERGLLRGRVQLDADTGLPGPADDCRPGDALQASIVSTRPSVGRKLPLTGPCRCYFEHSDQTG